MKKFLLFLDNNILFIVGIVFALVLLGLAFASGTDFSIHSSTR
jgi:hypothetical protein